MEIMNATQIQQILENTLNKVNGGELSSDQYVTVLQSVIVNQAKIADVLVNTCRTLDKRLKKIEKILAQAAQQAQARAGGEEAPTAGAQPAQGRAPSQGGGSGEPGSYSNGVRIGMDGQPLTPEEQALEEQMDAAINGG